MKMNKFDYQDLLQICISGTCDTLYGSVTMTDLKKIYAEKGHTMKRMRWDLMYHSLDNAVQGKYGKMLKRKATGFLSRQYQKGLNDLHIDTALRKITQTK